MTTAAVPASTQVRVPIPDADDESRKVYLALLERRCMYLGYENLRLRACLERATGQPWDSINLADPTVEELDEIVASELARGLRVPMARAREIVSQNKVMANPSQMESPAPDPESRGA